MLVQKLADAEGRQAALEKENDGLRDQLQTMEFQSGMPSQVRQQRERLWACGRCHEAGLFQGPIIEVSDEKAGRCRHGGQPHSAPISSSLHSG
jgi:hypothetical protein